MGTRAHKANVDNYKSLKHDICFFPEESIPDAQCQTICLENIYIYIYRQHNMD